MIDSKYDIYSCLNKKYSNDTSSYISNSNDNDKKIINSYEYEKGEDNYSNAVGASYKNDTTYLKKVVNIANKKGSDTNWFIAVDVNKFRVTVLKKKRGKWSVDSCFNASMGTLTNGRSHTGLFDDDIGTL